MAKIKSCLTTLSLISATYCFEQNTGMAGQIMPLKFSKNKFKETGVIFTSSDTLLKRLFDAAEAKAIKNNHYYSPGYNVMVEGEGYPFIWLEMTR